MQPRVPNDIPARYKKAALSWVVRQLKRGDPAVLGRPAQQALETYFNILGENLQHFISKPNIFDVASAKELIDVVGAANTLYCKRLASRANLKQDAEELQKAYVGQTENCIIYNPTTRGQCVILGRDANWCTRSPGLNYAEHYMAKGKLWVIIDKHDPARRFQLNICESDLAEFKATGRGEVEYEFSDRTNQPVGFTDYTIVEEGLTVIRRLDPAYELVKFEVAPTSEWGLMEDPDDQKWGYTVSTLRVTPTGKLVEESGAILHREDEPAVILADGTQMWYLNGKFHREDGPAVIWANGAQVWYQHGKIHREDGPAVIWANGAQVWYQHGKIHREDGPAVIEADGTQSWYQHGKRHREDGPAVIEAGGTQRWYQNDERHREDGPAVIGGDGSEEWYRNDERHREDGPAVIEADGTQSWHQHGKIHREDGPAWVAANGTQSWHRHGKRHREDGPAVIWADDTQEWYIEGKRHREDGPAVIGADGTQSWYINGVELTEREFNERTRNRGNNAT